MLDAKAYREKWGCYMPQRILIVEDDTALAIGLCRALQNEHMGSVSCKTLREARNLLQDRQTSDTQFALVLLDVNLPDGSGFDFLAEIKKEYGISVIMLTANDMETDIVAGLEMGADDYITKPFSLAVLRARVETQLRRLGIQSGHGLSQAGQGVKRSITNAKTEYEAIQAVPEPDQIIVIDDYRFNFTRMQFSYRGEQIELSKTEQKLLRILVENRGITLTRTRLLDYIWSVEAEFVDENALSVTVKRLRDKLDAHRWIKTVYGVGYRFE